LKLSFYIFLILAALGAYMADVLIDLHISVNYAGGGDDATCAAGSNFSCADVLKSSLASVFGIPIAVYGLAFYAVTAFLVCLRRFKENLLPGLPDVFFAGGLIITLYSIFLLIGSKVVVGKFCIRCMGLYGVNIALFATAWLSHPDGGRAALGRVAKVVTLPGFWATVLLLSIATPSTQYRYSQAADAAIKDQIEKKRIEIKNTADNIDVDPGKSPMRGQENAPVTIIEWADFQCGYCQQMAFSLKAALSKVPTAFKYHFKNYPLTNCSSNEGTVHRSCAAAIAFECAKDQGKAWEMHDMLFTNNHALEDDQLYQYSNMLGLDVETFRSCLKDPKAHERLKADVEQGMKLKIESTPTWYINGSRQVGPVTPNVILSMVQTARETAQNQSDKEKSAPAKIPSQQP